MNLNYLSPLLRGLFHAGKYAKREIDARNHHKEALIHYNPGITNAELKQKMDAYDEKQAQEPGVFNLIEKLIKWTVIGIGALISIVIFIPIFITTIQVMKGLWEFLSLLFLTA